MNGHERQGRAASIVAFIIEGCLTAGIADEALQQEGVSPEDIQAIKDELQDIAREQRERAAYHKRMERATGTFGQSRRKRG